MHCDLFGGFFTAINSVARSIGVESISSLVIDRTLYTFSKAHNLIFIIRTSTGGKQEQVRRLLNRVKQVFFKHFPPEQFWENNISLPAPDASNDNKDRIGHISYEHENIEELDADYREFFPDPLERMKALLWE